MAARDTTAPTLLSLTLPSRIVTTFGGNFTQVSIRTLDEGAGIDRAEIVLDRTFVQTISAGADAPLSQASFRNIITVPPSSFTGGASDAYISFAGLNPGTYNVGAVNVYDRQGNVTTYSAAQVQALGSATSFQVDSRNDDTAPLLNSLDLPNTVDLTSGNGASFVQSFSANTTESIARFQLTLDRPIATTTGTTSTITFGSTNGSTTPSTLVNFTQATAAGTYNVTQVSLIDRYGNATTLTGAQLAALGTESSFTVLSPTQRESVAPALTGLTVSTADITNLNDMAGRLTFNATATDASGIDRVVVRFAGSVYAFDGVIGGRAVSEVTIRGGVGQLNLLEGTARGNYPIASVEVFDTQGNSRVYQASELSALGVATSFNVVERAVDGGPGDDFLQGSALSDNITGFAGNDILVGLGGNDVLSGGSGNDRLSGGDGTDRLNGGDGNDLLDGGAGLDYLTGGRGDDAYVIDNFDDKITEIDGEGFDTITTSSNYVLANDVAVEQMNAADGANAAPLVLTGNSFFQTIVGNSAANSLFSAGGGDRLYGLGGNDMLYGDDGANILDGGTGADRMEGGDSGDIYYVDNVGDVIVENVPVRPVLTQGPDTVFASIDYTLPTRVEDLILTGAAYRADGNELANTIYGTGAANLIFGYGAADTIYGLGGDDSISAGDGDDGVVGGLGNDYILGDGGADFLFGNDGADTILGGDGNDNIFGGDGDDGIEGGTGTDRIEGGAGDDYIFGNDGDDLVLGDAGGDNLYGGTGNDVVGGGAGLDRMYGEEGNDRLYGDDGNDFIRGGDGNDFIEGGAGNDNLFGDRGEDIVLGGAGNDSISTGDESFIVRGDDIFGGGDGDDELFGGNGNDKLLGDGGNDRIDGGGGSDLIVGGAGNDTLSGGGGNDSFLFNAQLGADNVDEVGDFQHNYDAILLDRNAFGGLALGALSADAFVRGPAALDADDRIIFSGNQLFYDADGNGAGAAVLFATVNGDALQAADIIVV